MMRKCSCCRIEFGPSRLTCIRIDAAVSLTAWLCAADRDRLQRLKRVRRWMRWGWWTRVTG